MRRPKRPYPPHWTEEQIKRHSTTAPSPTGESRPAPQGQRPPLEPGTGEAGAGSETTGLKVLSKEQELTNVTDGGQPGAAKIDEIRAGAAAENLRKDSELALVLALESYVEAWQGGGRVEVKGRIECDLQDDIVPQWLLAVPLPRAPKLTSLHESWKRKVLWSLYLHKLDFLRLSRNKNDVRRWNCATLPDFSLNGKRCRSWRCYSCGDLRARMDAWKIEQGMKKKPRWFWLVTTLGKRLQRQDVEQNYREFSTRWNRLMIELRKAFGGDIVYIQTIEAHTGENGNGSQQPHSNTLFAGDFFTQASEKDVKKVKRWLKDNGVRFGFGFILHLVEVDQRRSAQVSRYISGFGIQTYQKASNSAIVGEVAKLKQVPTFSPKGTRRLRGSQHLMPKDKDYYAQFPEEAYEDKLEREERTRIERTDAMHSLERLRKSRLTERVQSLYQGEEMRELLTKDGESEGDNDFHPAEAEG